MSNPDGSATVYVGPAVTGRSAWSFLNGHGIEALLLEQNAHLVIGVDEVRVVVPEAKLEAALELLRELGLAPEAT